MCRTSRGFRKLPIDSGLRLLDLVISSVVLTSRTVSRAEPRFGSTQPLFLARRGFCTLTLIDACITQPRDVSDLALEREVLAHTPGLGGFRTAVGVLAKILK